MHSTLKSIGAVVAGFLTVAVLSTVTDEILHTANIMPRLTVLPTNDALLALAYRSVFTVLGGFVTAKLAPQNPMKHVWILAGIGLLGGLGGVAAATSQGFGPAWYAWAIAIEAIPLVWLGGTLAKAK